MAEFKKISETEIVEAPEENDTLVLVSDGVVKQVSAAAFAASAGGGAEPIHLIPRNTNSYSSNSFVLEDGSDIPSNLYDLYLAGTPILILYIKDNNKTKWFSVIGAELGDYQKSFTFYDFVEEGYKTFIQYL